MSKSKFKPREFLSLLAFVDFPAFFLAISQPIFVDLPSNFGFSGPIFKKKCWLGFAF